MTVAAATTPHTTSCKTRHVLCVADDCGRSKLLCAETKSELERWLSACTHFSAVVEKRDEDVVATGSEPVPISQKKHSPWAPFEVALLALIAIAAFRSHSKLALLAGSTCLVARLLSSRWKGTPFFLRREFLDKLDQDTRLSFSTSN
eukprot:CAMPEP_0198656856 /NCGR_PEP_ID=MMETSP1467-20131203/11169_1 /TAXON_ID=1462469 /ORGANISM="unid. sp., Strain CCMP2135" /LENGTH=146 /DNA_ID=CAMNT_0044392933 /DNA_START=165 /DNA_END=605 /DNA_ORIENTATION=+